MAVTSWTSEGMSWDDLHDKRLYPYIEAIRQATIERATVIGASVAADFQTPLTQSMIADYRQVRQTGYQIQSYLDSWINGGGGAGRFFVNSTDLSGNWDDSDHAPPAWTEADMLDAIGATERVRISAGSLFTADWARQQYLMLNNLIWTSYPAERSSTSNARKIWSGTGNWAAAVAGFNAAAWTGEPSNVSCPAHHVKGWSGPEGYEIVRYRSIFRNASNFPTGLNHTSKSYCQLIKGRTARGTIGVFEDPDYGVDDSHWAEVNDNNVPGNGTKDSYYVGNFASNTLAQPALDGIVHGWMTGYYLPGYSPGYGVVIAKWDVTGGYAYV